ncbi:flagellar basal-body MS-ring/collar protein FliF [Desulfothermus naphthae]
MVNFLSSWKEKIKELWDKGTLPQRVLAIGVLVSLTIVFIMLLYFLNREEYAVLYSNLRQEDSALIVKYLKSKKVKYKLKQGGTTILVPKDKVYDLRLEIAGQGLLSKGTVGFEIFSKSSIGQTDFIQQINYQRALQGELERTIMSMPEIQGCRVHLVLPKKSLFVEEQTPASASILVQLKRGKELSKEQVKSIVNLVATAVEGLKPENITLINTRGELLNRPFITSKDIALTTTQLEYKLNLEKTLSRRIRTLLIPVVGPGKVIAQVNVDLDLSEQNIYKELYDPDKTVIRSEQKVKESSIGVTQAETSKPGVQYQKTGSTTTKEQTERSQKTLNYEINKEERKIYIPKGQIDHITVAVLVDGYYKKGKDGNKIFVPRSKDELEKIKELVKNAVGINPKRGDSVEVVSMQFTPLELGGPTFWQVLLDYLSKFLTPILNSLVILLFLLLVVRPVVLSLIKPKVEEETAELEELPEGEEKEVEEPQLSEEELAALEAKRPFEELKQKVANILDKHSDEALIIIKNWMRDDVRR